MLTENEIRNIAQSMSAQLKAQRYEDVYTLYADCDGNELLVAAFESENRAILSVTYPDNSLDAFVCRTDVRDIVKTLNKILLIQLIEEQGDEPLCDDDTPTGGVSFSGETLNDFFTQVSPKSIDELNAALTTCGIKPLSL